MASVYLCPSKPCGKPVDHKLNRPYPRLGLEGLVMFKRDTQFDAENYTIAVPGPQGTKGTTISVFDKVVVRIEVEKDKNTQRGRVKMTLVKPIDSSGL